MRGFWFFGPYTPARQKTFVSTLASWPRQPVFGDGKNLRSISHVDNIVQAFLAAENAPATSGKWYWIGDAAGGYTVDAICETIAAAFGNRYRPFYVSKPLCRLIGVLDRLLGRCGRLHPTMHAATKFGFGIAGVSSAVQRDFGYTPLVGLEEAAAELPLLKSAVGG